MSDLIRYTSFFQRVIPLEKGWSSDQKFYIETQAGKRLLMRVADSSLYAMREREFTIVTKLAAMGLPVSQPIEFGACLGGKYVYSLLSWTDGEDAETVVRQMNPEDSFALGVKAGEILREFHSIPAPDDYPDCGALMRELLEKKKTAYQDCSIQVPHDREFLWYLEDTLPMLDGVRCCLLHGDYHVGNMIVAPDGSLHLIDFNRWKFSDPYRDFNRLATFSRMASIPFVRGQIAGYFGGKEPEEEFFRRMLFYTLLDALFGILWAIPFGEEEIRRQLDRSRMIYEDYEGMTSIVPIWYKGS